MLGFRVQPSQKDPKYLYHIGDTNPNDISSSKYGSPTLYHIDTYDPLGTRTTIGLL